METNRVEFTGTVERPKSIPTRSGIPMAKWLLKVGDSRFGCVAFGNLAGAILAAGEGKEIGVVGQGAINSWKTDDGAWRNDFQVTAWCIEIDGVATHFEKPGATRRPLKNEESGQCKVASVAALKNEHGRQQPQPARNSDEFAYRGGPF